MLAGRPDATLEHQVELLRFANFIIGIWIPNVVLSAEPPNLGTAVIVEL